LRYTHFVIENFKGIQKLRVDLTGHPAGKVLTFVGLNESGKTTILEAIDTFYPGQGELGPAELMGRIRADPDDLVPVASRSNFNGRVSITAGVELSDKDVSDLKAHVRNDHGWIITSVSKNFEITDYYEFKDSRYQKRGGEWSHAPRGRTPRARSDRPAYSANKDVWNATVDFLKNRVPQIWYFPDFLFEFPQRIYLEPQGNDQPKDTFYRALIEDVLRTVDKDANLADHLVARERSTEPADKRSLSGMQLDISRNLTRQILSAW